MFFFCHAPQPRHQCAALRSEHNSESPTPFPPGQMECLVLVNAVCTPPGWIEWGYQKMNVRHLKTSGMTQGVMDYLMWHHFGKVGETRADLSGDVAVLTDR